MKIKVWVRTNKIGSKCETTFDIPDSDFDGMNEAEKEEYISAQAEQEVNNMMEWDWVAE